MNRRIPPRPARTVRTALLAAACLALAGPAPAAETATAETGGAKAGKAKAATAPAAGRPSLPDLVARLLPAVVSITTTGSDGPAAGAEAPEGSPFEEHFREYFNRRRPPGRGAAVGSGFIVSADGFVVTNQHVVGNASMVHVVLDGGRQLDARVVGRDPRADLAVLKIGSETPLPFVEWGDSDTVRIGQDVVAIGNPFGLSQTVTTGILSARGRHLQNFGGMSGSSFVDFLQTDAAINKGNSGGPLFDRNGRVIGINTAIFSPRAEINAGIAFAVPSNLAAPIIEQLKRYGRTRRGWLGVQLQAVDAELAQTLGMARPTGALVANVASGGPAAKGGIVSGDVILEFDGRTVESASRLPQIVAATPVGKRVEVRVRRRGEILALKVVLGELEKAVKTGAARKFSEESVSPGLFPALGLRLGSITPELAQRYGTGETEGVIVLGVEPKSDAAQKGIEPGDVIEEMDQTALAAPETVRELMKQSKQAGKTSALLLVRRGEDRRYIVIRFRKR